MSIVTIPDSSCFLPSDCSIFFKKIFNCDIEAVYGNVIEKLANQNLIKEAGDLITLTDKGIDISNIVLANFLL